jgi:hypothetical protein
MSFIPHPTPPTDRQKADSSGLKLLSILKHECQVQFELAWKKRAGGQLVNKTQAEAQAFFDTYGVKAAMAFALHGKLQELIYMTDNSWVPLTPPYEYEVGKDGTVTIGELV